MPQVQSMRLLQELDRRKRAFSNLISAVLQVGPELAWVYYQEHGTGAGGKAGKLDYGGKGEYPITAHSATDLVFRSEGSGKLLFRQQVTSPGVPAHHFIAESTEEIVRTVGPIVARAMIESGFDFGVVKAVFLEEGMVEARQVIAHAIAQKLKVSTENNFGKLKGLAPEDVFTEGAQIVERTE